MKTTLVNSVAASIPPAAARTDGRGIATPYSVGWYVDGRPVRAKYMFDLWYALDFSRAWVDQGPSPAGNPGPYLKVPCAHDNGEETVHRVYPMNKRARAIVKDLDASIRVAAAPSLGRDVSETKGG